VFLSFIKHGLVQADFQKLKQLISLSEAEHVKKCFFLLSFYSTQANNIIVALPCVINLFAALLSSHPLLSFLPFASHAPLERLISQSPFDTSGALFHELDNSSMFVAPLIRECQKEIDSNRYIVFCEEFVKLARDLLKFAKAPLRDFDASSLRIPENSTVLENDYSTILICHNYSNNQDLPILHYVISLHFIFVAFMFFSLHFAIIHFSSFNSF
jgi:hypothetical protein